MGLESLHLEDDHQFEFAETVEALKFAAAESGRSPLSLITEWWRIGNHKGKLTIFEYLQYQLHKEEVEKAEKQKYISERIHWDVTGKLSDPHWRAATEDKWLSYQILSSIGMPCPKTVAVLDKGIRLYGNTPTLKSLDDVEAFLASYDAFPIFAKRNDDVGSNGALRIEGFEDGDVIANGGERVSLVELYVKTLGESTYLFQECVTNHADVAKLTKAVATVRSVNLVRDDGVLSPYFLMKIPMAKNVADNFWRDGNLLCHIDGETGKILRVVSRKGFQPSEHETHPETGENLIGYQLPDWEALRDLNERCARTFSAVRYQSLDIALTPEGPLIIEVNYGSSFMLPQTATGHGMLTPEIRAFFEEYGWSEK